MRPTQAEWRILDMLWQNGPSTLMELQRALEKDTGWSKHAVLSFLKRMEIKGSVRAEKKGRASVYTALLDREQAGAQETLSVAQQAFRGSVLSMMSNLVEREELSDSEIDELLALLHKAKIGKEERK